MSRVALLSLILAASAASLGACTPTDAPEAEEILADLPRHLGKRVTFKARFRSGARCRMNDPEAGWKTYCKDCQYCRGPLVVDAALRPGEHGLDDWPMILGGTYEGQDVRCRGPLGAVVCQPLEPGKRYIVRGLLTDQSPPKLMLDEVWPL
jgi:hypothetical protein